MSIKSKRRKSFCCCRSNDGEGEMLHEGLRDALQVVQIKERKRRRVLHFWSEATSQYKNHRNRSSCHTVRPISKTCVEEIRRRLKRRHCVNAVCPGTFSGAGTDGSLWDQDREHIRYEQIPLSVTSSAVAASKAPHGLSVAVEQHNASMKHPKPPVPRGPSQAL
ncbi:hypothetical protein AVEN_171430-1 [Araneus ventricosus]|uniref:Uncharacterized protein n=1 Tax=Araneus ventricosus TaxID=182803 RepID=A0A4Y2D5U5_ARAVE|nr:hypothetical protein AVEN_171430-1 [Araneus ventricosus]